MADSYYRYPPPPRPDIYPQRGSRSPLRSSREPLLVYPRTAAPPDTYRHYRHKSSDLLLDEKTRSWYSNPLNVEYNEYIKDRDIEWEKDLQNRLWESGYSRDLCHKILALHRRKKYYRESLLYGLGFKWQPYTDKIRQAVENEDEAAGTADKGGRGKNKGKERGYTRHDRTTERSRRDETRHAIHDSDISPTDTSEYYSDSSEDRGNRRGMERRLRRVEDALRNHRITR